MPRESANPRFRARESTLPPSRILWVWTTYHTSQDQLIKVERWLYSPFLSFCLAGHVTPLFVIEHGKFFDQKRTEDCLKNHRILFLGDSLTGSVIYYTCTYTCTCSHTCHLSPFNRQYTSFHVCSSYRGACIRRRYTSLRSGEERVRLGQLYSKRNFSLRRW